MSEKKKILIVGPTPPPYHGVSVFTNAILKSEIKNQFNIIHLDISDRRGISNIGEFDSMNIALSIAHGIKFLYLIIKYQPPLVYLPISENTAGFIRDCLFILPTILLRKKLMIHFHGGYFLSFYKNSNRMLKSLIAFIFDHVCCSIVLCHYYKQKLLSLIAENQMAVIPHGIDDLAINGKAKAASRSSISVLYLSNLIAEKGFFDVISAAHYVMKKRKDVKFVFAGTWNGENDKARAEKMIQKYNLESSIEFVGPVYGQKKLDLFSMSDIFVFPTYYKHESFGIVNLEAMAASLPIISTNKGCIRDLVIDNENGLIVEKQNPEQIAASILKLIEHPELRKKMGKKGRRKFEKYFTKETHIDKMIEVFNKVLSANG